MQAKQLLVSCGLVWAIASLFVACAAVDHEEPRSDTVFAVASYTTVVQPILASHCVACHSGVRPKGRLQLDTPAGIRAGGVGGPAFVAGHADESELVRRLHLPLDDEEHMPPGAKLQPTEQELAALGAWIDAGAPFEGHVAELAPFVVAPSPMEHELGPVLHPAPDAALAALRAALVHVESVAPGANGLSIDVSAIAAQFDDTLSSSLLAPVRDQVVELSLARATITDATLPLLAAMPHLERLDLRGTKITSGGLVHLVQLGSLKELVLAQTGLDDTALEPLLACRSLERAYLWRSGLTPTALARLRTERPALHVDAGDTPSASVIAAESAVLFTNTAPMPESSQALQSAVAAADATPINTTCPLTGAPVDPKFTALHNGRVIAFCCANCLAEFTKDPERYAASLP